jgi:MFS family permease
VVTGEILGVGRRRLALAAMVAAVAVVTLDTTILNVALPTIVRDLHTNLASLQWVIAGYSLTLASLLIIGGRVGDLLGVRRTFATGAVLFAIGSLVASVATSTPALVVGEAIIEGIGASLLFPASLAALSKTFEGPARASAFALWGGVAGAAAALGPVLGGWLTTDFSWRWGFRINVVVAPLAALAARCALPPDARPEQQPGREQPGREQHWRIDVRGAVPLAVGLFLLVFALTEAPAHGWLTNHGRGLALGPMTLWSSAWWLSPVPAAVAGAAVTLSGFVLVERVSHDPLVDLSLFARRSFRGGLATAAAVVIAQAGTMFVLAVFLQANQHLSAITAGRWLLPVGVAALVGAQTGGRVAPRKGPVSVVRVGIVIQLVGVLGAAGILRPGVDSIALAAMLALFGFGAGMASSQLTNVILSEVPRERAGSASGVSTTNNALAAALGVGILGAVLRVGSLNAGAARWAVLTGAALLAVGSAASFTIPLSRQTPGSRQTQPVPADRVGAGTGTSEPVAILKEAAHGSA